MTYEEFLKTKKSYLKEYEEKCKNLSYNYALEHSKYNVGDLITSQGKEKGVITKLIVSDAMYSDKEPEADYLVNLVGTNGKYKKIGSNTIFYQVYITDVKKAGTFKIKE